MPWSKLLAKEQFFKLSVTFVYHGEITPGGEWLTGIVWFCHKKGVNSRPSGGHSIDPICMGSLFFKRSWALHQF